MSKERGYIFLVLDLYLDVVDDVNGLDIAAAFDAIAIDLTKLRLTQ